MLQISFAERHVEEKVVCCVSGGDYPVHRFFPFGFSDKSKLGCDFFMSQTEDTQKIRK